MRNRNTLEYLSLWEELNNENCKYLESDVFKKESWLNAFLINPTKWIKHGEKRHELVKKCINIDFLVILLNNLFIMIITDSYVSISDVRDKTTSIIKSLNNVWTKIVLSQNKPVWVFLSIDTYNNLKKASFLKEQATEDDMEAYKNSSHWSEGVEAFSFLQSLK